jgi:hypothetical protein
MFRSQFSDNHQGSINRTCAITTYQRACIIVVQTTYSHILEYDDARTLISSNCTSTVVRHYVRGTCLRGV